MKLCSILLLLSFIRLTANPLPELSAQDAWGNSVPLKIAKFEVEVLLFEDLAQTTFTIAIENPTHRNIEGEFSLPLPPGVTISGYQLEVNGKMRNSTVVDPARARFAYESIKRRNIDPGYIERQPGNIYRTKIFPILPGKSKALKLTFCQTLTQKENHLQYHLPLPPVLVKSPKVTVRHLQNRKVTFIRPSIPWSTQSLNGALVHFAPKRVRLTKLVLQLDKINTDLFIAAPPFSYRRSLPKDSPQPIIPTDSKALEIIWDCSESGRNRDIQKEFALLDKLFKKHLKLTVHLTRLRLTPEKARTFHIKNGDWQALRNDLIETFYDGGTDLASITPRNIPTLLFSDGQSSYNRLKNSWPADLTLIDSQGRAALYWLDQIKKIKARYLDLTRIDHLDPLRHEFAILPDDHPETNKIPSEAQNIIAQLATSQKLRTLESEFNPSPEKITAHCKQYHLVSAFTSLIVLERFEDHLLYRIPPPEPELRKKYDEIIRNKEQSLETREVLGKQLKDRRDWHTHNFSWHHQVLDPAISRLSIWQRSLLKTFQPDELNPQALKSLENTIESLRNLKREQADAKLESLDAHAEWVQKVKGASSQITKLESLTYGKTTNNKIAVALNGFVNRHGRITLPANSTLEGALKNVGGISKLGSPSRVALYRNSRKTIYNLFSREFTDIPLRSGDLIVVQQAKLSESASSWDPFADDFMTVDYRNEPPIIPASREPNYSPGRNDDTFEADPFGSGRGASSSKSKNSPASLFDLPESQDPKDLNLAEVSKELTAGRSPVELYQSLRPRNRYPDDFYLQLGDLYLKHKDPRTARRILSNLIESPSPRPSAYRKWAYVLAKHADWRGARDLLNRAARLAPQDHTITLDQAWVTTKLNKLETTQKHLKKINQTFDPNNSSSRLLAEIAAVESQKIKSEDSLPLDIRVIITSASGQDLHLRLAEPLEAITHFGSSHDTTQIGARAFNAVGIAQYSLHKAISGQYDISFQSERPQIARIQIYRDWGKPSQTCEEAILFLPATETRRHLVSIQVKLN